MVKVSDFSLEMVKEICEIINKGYQCEVKRERDCIVIVEVRRKAFIKNPIKQVKLQLGSQIGQKGQ